MSTALENLVSVDDIHQAIETFIGKYPENVSIWVDGETIIIQLSNIGVRSKLFTRLAYLVENTMIENKLKLFNMPAKCVYVSDQILRFTCTINELDSCVKNYYNHQSSPKLAPEKPMAFDPRLKEAMKLYVSPIEKFYSRLSRSAVFKRIQSILNNDSSSKISVYVISKPEAHDSDENGNPGSYVNWEVIGILDIEAGTTWNNYDFKERLSKLKQSKNINCNCGEYGTFNVDFIGETDTNNDIIEDYKYIGKRPEFVLDSSVKVGDIINSRNYEDREIWDNGFNYQTYADDYQKYRSFYNIYPASKVINHVSYGETLIPDGAIITI